MARTIYSTCVMPSFFFFFLIVSTNNIKDSFFFRVSLGSCQVLGSEPCDSRWCGEEGGQEAEDGRKHFMIYAVFLKYVPSTYCIVLLLLSFGGPEAWATHIICLKIILQPVWVSLWCLFHNNCLWIFIKIQVGWDLEPTMGPVHS